MLSGAPLGKLPLFRMLFANSPIDERFEAVFNPILKVSLLSLLHRQVAFIRERFPIRVYDPMTGNWQPTGDLTLGRWLQAATELPNGKVVVTGGFDGDIDNTTNKAEVYDSINQRWVSSGHEHTPRFEHTATTLPRWQDPNYRRRICGGLGLFEKRGAWHKRTLPIGPVRT